VELAKNDPEYAEMTQAKMSQNGKLLAV